MMRESKRLFLKISLNVFINFCIVYVNLRFTFLNMSLTKDSMEKLLDKKFSEFRNGDLAQLKEAIDSIKKAMAFISQQYDYIIKTVHDLKRDRVLDDRKFSSQN